MLLRAPVGGPFAAGRTPQADASLPAGLAHLKLEAFGDELGIGDQLVVEPVGRRHLDPGGAEPCLTQLDPAGLGAPFVEAAPGDEAMCHLA